MFYPGPVGATFDSGPAGATFDSGPAGATFDPSPADTIIYPGPAVASFNPGAEEATERDTMNGTSRRGGTVRQTCTVPTIPFSRLRRTGRSANQPSHSVASVAPGGRPTNHPFQSSPSRRAVGQPTIPFSRLRRAGRAADQTGIHCKPPTPHGGANASSSQQFARRPRLPSTKDRTVPISGYPLLRRRMSRLKDMANMAIPWVASGNRINDRAPFIAASYQRDGDMHRRHHV